MTGALSSVPSSDQVPELRNARTPPHCTDATADAVSWHAGTTTGVPACAADASRPTGPTIVPASTSGGSSRVGIPSLDKRLVAHSRVRASTHCVVVAIVYSAFRRPVSQ